MCPEQHEDDELIAPGEGSGEQPNPEDSRSTSSPEDIPSPEPTPPQDPAQNLVSTGSNTSPILTSSLPSTNTKSPVAQFQPVITESPQTFPTTIPSHPSTIQYIPLIPTTNPGLRATFHIIPTKPVVTTTSETTSRTVYQYERGTIHYPPTTVQILQSVPPLIMTSGSVISASVQAETTQTEQKPTRNLLQLISTPQQTQTVRPQFLQTVRTSSSNTETSSPNTPPRTPSNPSTSSPLSDQHIRVLTPSEIMRTLPSLGQETYDPPPSMVSSIASMFSFQSCLFITLHMICLKNMFSYFLFI